jgi:hypothetical protein
MAHIKDVGLPEYASSVKLSCPTVCARETILGHTWQYGQRTAWTWAVMVFQLEDSDHVDDASCRQWATFISTDGCQQRVISGRQSLARLMLKYLLTRTCRSDSLTSPQAKIDHGGSTDESLSSSVLALGRIFWAGRATRTG